VSYLDDLIGEVSGVLGGSGTPCSEFSDRERGGSKGYFYTRHTRQNPQNPGASSKGDPTKPPKPGEVTDGRICSGCGRSGFVVMVVTGCGDHLCRTCWRDSTCVAPGRQPKTPTLDRLMAKADARAEREKA
jgi:hypothetical protein